MVCEGVCVCVCECDDFEQTCVCVYVEDGVCCWRWAVICCKRQLWKAVCHRLQCMEKWPSKLRGGTQGGTFDSRKDMNWPARARVRAQQGAAHNPCCHRALPPITHSRIIPHPRPTRWQTTSRQPAQKCHNCHAKQRSISPSSTQNSGPCRQVPCLPHKTTAASRASRASRSSRATSPVPEAPHLPRKTKVHVTNCHACHAKRRWMSPSDKDVCERWCVKDGCVTKMVCERGCVTNCHACHAKRRWMSPSDKDVCQRWCAKDGRVTKMMCERWCVKDGVWQSCVTKVCEKWCVKDGVWQVVCVCERWCVCVTKVCVGKIVCVCVWKLGVCERWCVKDGVWQVELWQSCVWKLSVWKMVRGRWCVTSWVVWDECERWCVCVWQVECDKEAADGRGGGGRYRSKNKNPTQRCGQEDNKIHHVPHPEIKWYMETSSFAYDMI